jgi:hypothetical protein
MLKQVMHELAQRGWIDAAADHATSIFLTRGSAWWMLLSLRGEAHTFVKVSDRACLCTEAVRCAAAHASYPGLTPRFIGHLHQLDQPGSGLDLLVCQAVPSVAVGAAGMTLGRPVRPRQRQLVDGLLAYFGAMPGAQPAPQAPLPDITSLYADMRRYYADHPLADLALPWLNDQNAQRVAMLPAMPQHGDLVLNNLGLGPQGLVVFDWEDYGAWPVPGLDLYTMMLSLWPAFGAGQGANLPAMVAVHGEFVDQACQAMHLPVRQFVELMPLHALAFRYLKRHYGEEVRQRMDQVIATLPRPGAHG